MKRCTNIKQSTCLLPIVISLQMKGKMNKPFPVILGHTGLCAGEPNFDCIEQTRLGPSLIRLKHLLTALSSHIVLVSSKQIQYRLTGKELAKADFCRVVPSQCQMEGLWKVTDQ